MKITASLKQQSFLWDFAVDGGAISSINMGVFIPANCIIHSGYAAVLTTLTSGGSATVAIGFAGSTGALMSATAVASLAASTVVNLTEKVSTTVLQQLQLTIAAAALTAGKIICVIEYEEVPFPVPSLTPFAAVPTPGRILNFADMGTGLVTDPFAVIGTDANVLQKTLASWTIPTNTLAFDGQGLRLRAGVKTAANANFKQVDIELGAELLYQMANVSIDQGFLIDLCLFRMSGSVFMFNGFGLPEVLTVLELANSFIRGFDNGDVRPCAWNAPQSLTLKGTNGVAVANDIQREYFLVTYF